MWQRECDIHLVEGSKEKSMSQIYLLTCVGVCYRAKAKQKLWTSVRIKNIVGASINATHYGIVGQSDQKSYQPGNRKTYSSSWHLSSVKR